MTPTELTQKLVSVIFFLAYLRFEITFPPSILSVSEIYFMTFFDKTYFLFQFFRSCQLHIFSFLELRFPFVSDSSLSLLTSLFISASSHPLPLSVDIRCTSLSHSKDICNANERNIRKSTLPSFQTHPPLDTLFLHPLSYYFHTLQTLPPPKLCHSKMILEGEEIGDVMGRFCLCGPCRIVLHKIK